MQKIKLISIWCLTLLTTSCASYAYDRQKFMKEFIDEAFEKGYFICIGCLSNHGDTIVMPVMAPITPDKEDKE